jgi:hypothetical protein
MTDTEDDWTALKNALAEIERINLDTLDDWVLIGENLIALDRLQGGSEQFPADARRYGIRLTSQQRAAAIWWASLKPEWRDRLHREFPDTVDPVELRKQASGKYPNLRSRR